MITRVESHSRRKMMMPNLTLEEFRMKMAESGHEHTPDESARLYRAAIDLAKRAKKMSQADLWQIIESDLSEQNISEEEKTQLVELLQYAREIC